MKKILALVLLAPVLFAIPAAYAAPSELSGSFTVSAPVVTSTRTVGQVTIIEQDVTAAVSGTISGQCVGSETDIINEQGTFIIRGMCTFSGMIGGRSGTAVFVARGVFARNGFHGHFVALSSSGGLEGLHAWTTLQITGPGTGTYSGHYFFTD